MFNLDNQYLIQQRAREARAQIEADQQPTKTELTPAGEQHVIPGCERNASPKASQLDLFG